MISLLIMTAFFVASLLISAGAVTFAARAVGSPRGRFRTGLVVALILLLVNVACLIVKFEAEAKHPDWEFRLGLILLGIQIFAAFGVIQKRFALPFKRAFAPFGAMVGAGLLQVVLGLGVVRPFLTEAFLIPAAGMNPTVLLMP